MFDKILGKIFPSHHPAVTGSPPAAPATPATPAEASAPTAGATPPAAGIAAPAVDVEAVLNGLAQQRSERLNWRSSIVDLMKLLDLDSSLAARKELAAELHYGGDTNDSAAMNVWLHQQVMDKLAANGGKVPDDLRH